MRVKRVPWNLYVDKYNGGDFTVGRDLHCQIGYKIYILLVDLVLLVLLVLSFGPRAWTIAKFAVAPASYTERGPWALTFGLTF